MFIIEIVHGTHLEAIMKSVEWQQKMLRGNLRVTRVKDKDSNERRNKKLPNRTKYTARLKKSSSTILTASTYHEMSCTFSFLFSTGKRMSRFIKLLFLRNIK